MCTAIHKDHLFGRTLDLECSFGESVTLTPRGCPLSFLYDNPLSRHLAFWGCAHVRDGRAFYYDGMNEAGVAIAALNFPVSAHYAPPKPSYRNLASFEVIPALLSQCQSAEEAKDFLKKAHITDDAAHKELPTTPLHWMVADLRKSFVAEPTAEELRIYDNPVGVLTNEPPFPYHMTHLSDYLSLSPIPPENHLAPSLSLSPYSRGMGAMGLPGDGSSASRFVRAVYGREHLQWNADHKIEDFFHLMDTVAQPKGLSVTDKGEPIYTVYTDCMDLSALSYSYTTYGNRTVRSHSFRDLPLDGDTVFHVPMDS
ncbi:MAG: choloylglycine hydrolase family protein [Clostridia bacterium]|nr:choloylglycine hydrolase family protein [Clostridia bacterium]